MKRVRPLLLVCTGLVLAGAGGCGGTGSGGSPPTVRIAASECAPLLGEFPPGFAWMPGGNGVAVGVVNEPPAALFFDMNGEVPELLAPGPLSVISPDSDGDGMIDEDQRLCAADPVSKIVIPGKPLGVSDQLAFIAGSGYEQVMFARAPRGELAELVVINPPNTPSGSYHGEDYPYLPDAFGKRTAISTKACIYLPDGKTKASNGEAVGQHPCCTRLPAAPSFFTAFTSGMTLAAGHLFVATSNFDSLDRSSVRYFPGTVLVYDLDLRFEPQEIQPNVDTPVILTTGFNPTGVSRYRTPGGRELVLVTNSGALRGGTGAGNILTESFIDVIDASSRRLVATVPMGFAGLSFEGVAIDPAKRVGLIGSWAQPVLYAIDLRVFDDEALFAENDPPSPTIWLDGSDAVFPDARIFHADRPFNIPDRTGGPHPILCDGWTFVAINEAGESAYVLERCDGTLSQLNLLDAAVRCGDTGGTDGCCDRVPLPSSCFSIGAIQFATEPFNAPATEDHAPSQISVRPGEPGIDYTGPDVFFLVDLPDGKLCSQHIDSF